MAKLSESSAQSEGNRKRPDVAKVLPAAIDLLISENLSVKQRIIQNEPIIRQRLVYDLLNNNASKDPLRELWINVGIHFPFEHYIILVVLVEPHLHKLDHQLKLTAFSIIEEEYSKRYHVAGTLLEHGKYGYVLNVEEPSMEESMQNTVREMNEHISGIISKERDSFPQFVVSPVLSTAEEMGQVFISAIQLLHNRAVIFRDHTLFIDAESVERPRRYPTSMQKLLAHSVLQLNRSQVDHTVDLFFERFVLEASSSSSRVQGLLTLLLGHILHQVLEAGYELEEEAEEIYSLRINECTNVVELQHYVKSLLHQIMSGMELSRDMKHDNLYILKAIEYMKAHYSEPLSITDIAEHLGITGGYLSNLFKAELKETPLEHLTAYRIARSKQLFEDTSLTMKEIGERVGYPDVNSFIRFFKKHEGLTPGKYKKSVLDGERLRLD